MHLPSPVGRSGWGIAWYINSTLAPVIRATRGNTYTFYVYGGSNASNAGSYHPFYISDYIAGGRLANTLEEVGWECVTVLNQIDTEYVYTTSVAVCMGTEARWFPEQFCSVSFTWYL